MNKENIIYVFISLKGDQICTVLVIFRVEYSNFREKNQIFLLTKKPIVYLNLKEKILTASSRGAKSS